MAAAGRALATALRTRQPPPPPVKGNRETGCRRRVHSPHTSLPCETPSGYATQLRVIPHIHLSHAQCAAGRSHREAFVSEPPLPVIYGVSDREGFISVSPPPWSVAAYLTGRGLYRSLPLPVRYVEGAYGMSHREGQVSPEGMSIGRSECTLRPGWRGRSRRCSKVRGDRHTVFALTVCTYLKVTHTPSVTAHTLYNHWRCRAAPPSLQNICLPSVSYREGCPKEV